jgi:hypothetical protein
MTATTIKVTEGVPEGNPAVTVSTEATPFLPVAWARVESHIALRITERAVTWIVEGCGEWAPPLWPATIETVEEWRSEAWAAVTVPPSPLGGYCLPEGTYRFSGSVGADTDAPALLLEAVRRLTEYMAEITFEHLGIRSENVPDIWSGEYASPSWRARALQDSGAADLLRSFRRA